MLYCNCCNPSKEYEHKKSLRKHQVARGCAPLTSVELVRLRYVNEDPKCAQCDKSLTYEDYKNKKKFCGSSCSATFNRTGYKHSEITKLKIAESNRIASAPACAERRLLSNKKFRTYKPRSPRISKPTGIFTIARANGADYSLIKRANCSYCSTSFWANRRGGNKSEYSRLCSDKCYIASKTKNAKGIKRVEYNGIWLDSNWEKEIAIWLDEQKIYWIRPSDAILWLDSNGKTRRYFADFYLPDHNLFLDPKNPFVISKQKEKLEEVSKLVNLIYGSPTYLKDAVLNHHK